MKKIGIYLERKPDSGGAYQYCLAVLKALSELPEIGFQVMAFCTYKEWGDVTKPFGIRTIVVQKNFIEKVVNILAEKIFSVDFYRKHCRLLHPLARKFKEEKIDVCIYPCGDKISFMLDTAAVVTVFDLMHRYLKDFPEISAESIYRSRERSYTNIAKYAKLILVDSEVGKQQMLECYGEYSEVLANKIVVLPFIAPDYVYHRKGEVFQKEEMFKKYIFYPAQFWKHKNHKNLLLAMSALKKKNIVVNAIFCGAGKNAYEEVREFILQLGLEQQVKIIGYVSNEKMVSLYQNARALVMPTFGGPTNIPQLEAFVLGCPVATSRIFAIPEQVGDAALLFNPASVEEITSCIEQLWTNDDLCQHLRERGFEKSRQWGEKQFAEKLHLVLEDMKIEKES